MPFPRASKALARFTVLDLTRVRSGPTCVRQLADWGANVIKIETPPGLEEPMGGPREGGDFQNLHRNKRSMTLNLKAPEGLAAFKRMVKKADVVVENFRPDVKKRLGIDYKALAKINPRIVYASISGFGQDGPLCQPAGLRPDRAGHGRADVDHRPAGARAGARRHSDRRSHAPGCSPRSASWSRCWSATNPARASTSRPRCCRRRSSCSTSRPRAIWSGRGAPSRPATIIRPASRPACSRPTTATSTSPPPARKSGSGSATPLDATGLMKQAGISERRARARRTATRSTPRSRAHLAKPHQRRLGRALQRSRRAVRADLRHRPGVRRSAGRASRHRAEASTKKDKSKMPLVGQPVSLSRTPSQLVARPPELGEHTDAVLKEFGFQRARHRRAAQGQGGVMEIVIDRAPVEIVALPG